MDKYAWHMASGGPRHMPYWVLREKPRGGREVLMNKSGRGARYFKEMDAAQREADRLNAQEHDWTAEELEMMLEEGRWSETGESIIRSHIRAVKDRDFMANILANEAERGYDVSRIGPKTEEEEV